VVLPRKPRSVHKLVMAASPQKPLPAIPVSRSNQPYLTTLTVDSEAHLAALIQYVLSEYDSIHFEDGGKEAWTRAFEYGLSELGDNISRGGWLAGLKRRRKALKSEIAKQLLHTDQEKAVPEKDNEESEKFKVKKKQVQGTTVALGQGPSASESRGLFAKTRLPHSRNVDTARALEQIRDLVNKHAAPTPKPAPKHLLLTVARLGSRLAIPAEDSGFDLVPANIACIFTPGTYSLPDSLCDDAGGSVILYGLDEWDGQLDHPAV
jgi:1-phosphatidylinositol-3-phosphate 5-kinase